MAALQGHTVISTSPPKGNLEATTEVYNDRVQDALFGKTTIRNFKDANNENATYLPESREKLLSFLHGSKSVKQELKKETQHFTDIVKRCGRFEIITDLLPLCRELYKFKSVEDSVALTTVTGYDLQFDLNYRNTFVAIRNKETEIRK